MRFYAEQPARAAVQLLVDGLVAGWLLLCVTTAGAARDLIDRLQEPGRMLTGAGEAIRGTFADAARAAGQVPFVGDDLARSLGAGTEAGESLALAGRQQVETFGSIAVGTGVGIVVLGTLPVLAVWLPLRLRYARAAGSAIRVRTVDSDLLALRAIAHLPVRRLLTVSPDPASAWRRGDRAVVHGLAELELRSLGLRPPGAPPD